MAPRRGLGVCLAAAEPGVRRLWQIERMYRNILVALENTKADRTLVPHVTELARRLGSQLLLVHVADGWAARNYERLKLRESEEMKADLAYLEETASTLRGEGLTVKAQLALGDPPSEILRTAEV